MKYLKTDYIDKTFWGLFIALIIVAILALFSAGSTLVYKHNSALGPVGQQMLFIAIGVAIAYSIQFLPSWIIRFGGYGLLAISILCLYVILIPGNPFVMTINGASRWMKIGSFAFQPSELAKLSLIIVVADLLARIKSEQDKKKYFYWTLGITLVTAFPILTGNLSTALLLCAIVFAMWVLARIPWQYLCSVVAIALVAMALGYSIIEFGFVRPHRSLSDRNPLKRAVTWVNRVDEAVAEMHQPTAEFKLTEDNYQRSIAKVAIARGGKSPLGVLPGNSKERDFLPLAFADYIFAIIVEESGLIGAIILIAIYLAILFRACYASSRFADYASMLMVMGLALMITCQALVSMMVAVGIGPVTGQPLPLISRGGTSVLITSVYFGIMLCVSREQTMLSERQSATRKESLNDVPDITFEA